MHAAAVGRPLQRPHAYGVATDGRAFASSPPYRPHHGKSRDDAASAASRRSTNAVGGHSAYDRRRALFSVDFKATALHTKDVSAYGREFLTVLKSREKQPAQNLTVITDRVQRPLSRTRTFP